MNDNSELLEKALEGFDALIGGGLASISSLLDSVKALTESNEEFAAENTALRERMAEVQKDREAVTLKCALYEKQITENSVDMAQRQCALAEAAKEKAKASALAASNTDLKRENSIYRAELESSRREIYGINARPGSSEKINFLG